MEEPWSELKRLVTVQRATQPHTSGHDGDDSCGGGDSRLATLQQSYTQHRAPGADAEAAEAPIPNPVDPSHDTTPPMSTADTENTTDRRWDRAVQLLRDNPHLITRDLLCAALKHDPPGDVVRLILQHDSGLASAPLLLLHLALVNRCRTGAVQALLEKCPPAVLKVKARIPAPTPSNNHFSSIGEAKEEELPPTGNSQPDCGIDETAPFELLDPLSYVQKYRPDDTDLIDLLRRATEEEVESAPSRLTGNEVSESLCNEDLDAGSAAASASASALTRATSNRHRPSLPTEPDGETHRPLAPSASSLSLPSSSKPLSLMNLCASGATTLWHGTIASSPEALPYPSLGGGMPTASVGFHRDRRSKRTSDTVDASLPATADCGQVLPTHHHYSRRHTYQPNDEEELVNVKRLCAAVVKGHRKLSQRMDELTRSTVESNVASEERVLTALQAELNRRDSLTSAAMAEWHQLVVEQMQESVSLVREAAKKREDELVRRLATLERQIQEYELFRSFEVDPPPEALARRTGKKETFAPLDASGTAISLTATTANLDGSFDDSWTTWDAAPSFGRFDCTDFDDGANFFMWTSHEKKSADYHTNWLGRYVFEDEAKVDDVARSLLSDDGMECWNDLRSVNARTKANQRRQRGTRRSCLVWLLPRSPQSPFQRWFIAVKSGAGKLCINPTGAL